MEKVSEYLKRANRGKEVTIFDTKGKYTKQLYSGDAGSVPEKYAEEYVEEADEYEAGVDLFI